MFFLENLNCVQIVAAVIRTKILLPSFQSFSELFVSFLEQESSPRPQVRLPTDQMVKEQQHRKQTAQQRARTAFNPFAVPAHAPGQGGHMGAGGSMFSGSFGSGGGASLLSGATGSSGQNILTDPGGGSGASHLLMSSPGRPSFSPLTIAARESPTHASTSDVPTSGGTGRASGSNSGRNTPAAAALHLNPQHPPRRAAKLNMNYRNSEFVIVIPISVKSIFEFYEVGVVLGFS